jgi:hypothetical protein
MQVSIGTHLPFGLLCCACAGTEKTGTRAEIRTAAIIGLVMVVAFVAILHRRQI